MQDFNQTHLKRLEIEVTDKCILHCLHCSLSCSSISSHIMPKSLILSLIDDAYRLGGEKVVLTGGEPLVLGQNKISYIISHAIAHNLYVDLYTSGILITEEFLKKFANNKFLRICVSLLGKESTHDQITQTAGSYKKVIESLSLLKNYNINSCIHFVPLKLNLNEIDNVIDTAKLFQVNRIKFFKFVPQGRGLENRETIEPTLNELQNLCTSILHKTNENTLNIDFGGVIPQINKSCSIGKKIAITYDGYALPCLGLRNRPDYSKQFGNIHENTIEEIYEKIKQLDSKGCICSCLDKEV